jgi:hypothetical protein
MAKRMYMNGERNIHKTYFPRTMLHPTYYVYLGTNSLLYYPKGPQHGLQCQDIGTNLGTPVPVLCKDQF